MKFPSVAGGVTTTVTTTVVETGIVGTETVAGEVVAGTNAEMIATEIVGINRSGLVNGTYSLDNRS